MTVSIRNVYNYSWIVNLFLITVTSKEGHVHKSSCVTSVSRIHTLGIIIVTKVHGTLLPQSKE